MHINKFLLLSTCVTIFFLISACSAKKYDENLETRSITQIHEDEGVPVKTMEIKKQEFAVALKYTATVTGITESSATSLIKDSVEKVLFKVGDFVEKDTVIIKFPLNNPSANYYQAKAAHENSRETFKRIEQLYKSKGVSRQDYDNAKTGYDVAKANWDNVNKMVNVTAPISGYITRLDVRVSENVSSGDHLFTVTNYDKLTGKVWILEKDISKVKKGLNAEAIWEGNTIKGKTTQIDLSLNPSRQAFGAFIEFDNKEHTIMSGVNADINLFAYENKSAIAIEKKYLLSDNEGSYVYIIGHENTPIKRLVKTGWQSGEKIEITHGLAEGDTLITEGSKFITDSVKIRVVAGE
ncbi:MAG: efflux RND transporter periplasmic adaptor subunit [Spirochaetaceae bacterium]|nr:efflux RND transporter periplasmic adaptor subunit [Spirochaetaceae bacterium]